MNVRLLSIIWILALLPVILVCAFVSWKGAQLDRQAGDLGLAQLVRSSAETVVIGSSLSRNALPPDAPQGGGVSLANDGTSHIRIAIGNITGDEVFDLLAAAVERGSRRIFVELNPLAIDRDGLCGQSAALSSVIPKRVRQLGVDLRRVARYYRSGGGLTRFHEPRNLDEPFTFSRRLMEALAPPTYCDLTASNRLSVLAGQARERGTQIAFITVPKSRSYADFGSNAQADRIVAHLSDQAGELGIDLFTPAVAWPDSFFADHIHLNRAGRARYMRELSAWIADRK